MKLMWEGSVWILMDPYGPVWVRMVPEDSLGASWGLLGPWGGPKGGKGVFGGGPPPGGPCCGSVSGCLGFLLAYHRNPYASAAGCCKALLLRMETPIWLVLRTPLAVAAASCAAPEAAAPADEVDDAPPPPLLRRPVRGDADALAARSCSDFFLRIRRSILGGK